MSYASVLNALRPSVQSNMGFLLSETKPMATAYLKAFGKAPLSFRVQTAFFRAIQGSISTITDLLQWIGMTITIIPMTRIGLKNHLVNLIATLVAPFFCFALLLGYEPAPNYSRPFDNPTNVNRWAWHKPTDAKWLYTRCNARDRPEMLSQLLDHNEAAVKAATSSIDLDEKDADDRTQLFRAVLNLDRAEGKEFFYFLACRKGIDPRLQPPPIDCNTEDKLGLNPLTCALLGIGEEHGALRMIPNRLIDHEAAREEYASQFSFLPYATPCIRKSIWLVQKLIEEGAILHDLRFNDYREFCLKIHKCWQTEDQATLEQETTALCKRYQNSERYQNSDNRYIQAIVKSKLLQDVLRRTNTQYVGDPPVAEKRKAFAKILLDNANTLEAAQPRIAALWRPHYEKYKQALIPSLGAILPPVLVNMIASYEMADPDAPQNPQLAHGARL